METQSGPNRGENAVVGHVGLQHKNDYLASQDPQDLLSQACSSKIDHH